MYQDMLITLSAPSNLLRNQLSSPSQSQPSALPPYTPTPSSHPTKFELSYPPPSPQNPITPIYRSQTLLPPLSDGSPPEYRHSLQTIDSNLKPAYVLHFDESTQNTILKTPEGQTVTSISFLKPRRQTVTTFSSSDVDAQTLAGSSFTLADDDDDEGQDGSHILLHSETLSNGEDDNNDRVQEEVGSILLDTVPAKQTITLSSHKYFHPKGTKFTTPSGNSEEHEAAASDVRANLFSAEKSKDTRKQKDNRKDQYILFESNAGVKGRTGRIIRSDVLG